MKYRSTRGGVSGLTFKEAVMMGLASDGGLLVPHQIPDLSDQMHSWKHHSYADLAFEIMSRFIDDIEEEDLRSILKKSYATFDDVAITPLVPVADFFVLELFHGPTLAFKDIALQFLGNVFDHILSERGDKLNILGATSGDTGSAAISATRGRQNIDIYIMFPEGRTSDIQERQMTTVLDDNVHNIAIDGSFDDCQHILKALFNDAEFKSEYQLGAVNSVNWARVLAQVVYYFSAWYQLQCPSAFEVCVPTGNFGNVFSATIARRLGLPIKKIILATNCNDILARFFADGTYAQGEVRQSFSPAMDIQVASNLERYLFYWFQEDAAKVKEFMEEFARTGKYHLHFNTPNLDSLIAAASATDEQTINTIAEIHASAGYLVDPHTAVGLCVGQQLGSGDIPLVYLATAHPAKFSDVILKAVPEAKVSHPLLEKLRELPTRKTLLAADPEVIRDFIRKQSPGT